MHKFKQLITIMQENVEINPVLERLFVFIRSKGGFSKVGRSIGKASQMFHNLAKRNAKPSVETLEAIAEAYPDIDFNYILKGIETVDREELSKTREQVGFYEEIMKRAFQPGPKHKGVTVKSPKVVPLKGWCSVFMYNKTRYMIHSN